MYIVQRYRPDSFLPTYDFDHLRGDKVTVRENKNRNEDPRIEKH